MANELKIPITFVGKFQETDTNYCKKFSIESETQYVDHRQNLTDYQKLQLLLDSRAFINLSLGESGCISVLEAFALKMPVILPLYHGLINHIVKLHHLANIGSFKKQKKNKDFAR